MSATYKNLAALFSDAKGEVELAWSDAGRDAPTNAEHFPLSEDGLRAFAERAQELNEGGANCYFIPAALRPGVNGRARNEDVAQTTVLWADVDDPSVAESPYGRCGSCPPGVIVITRPGPERRVHLYWGLTAPVTDRETIRRLNRQIAAKVGADMAATNPARLMRVPGTTRWPTEKKPVGPHQLQAWGDGDAYSLREIEISFPSRAQKRDYGLLLGDPRKWSHFFVEPVREGERNSKLMSLAGKLIRCRLDPLLAHDLVQSANACYVDPPLDEDEVTKLVDRCCIAELRRRSADV